MVHTLSGRFRLSDFFVAIVLPQAICIIAYFAEEYNIAIAINYAEYLGIC